MVLQSSGGVEKPSTLPSATAQAKCENQKICTLRKSMILQSPEGLEKPSTLPLATANKNLYFAKIHDPPAPRGTGETQYFAFGDSQGKERKSKNLYFAKIHDPPVPRWTGET